MSLLIVWFAFPALDGQNLCLALLAILDLSVSLALSHIQKGMTVESA